MAKAEMTVRVEDLPQVMATLARLQAENERLRAVADWVRQYQAECEAPAGAKDPMLRASIRQSMFDAAAEVEEGSD